MNAKPNQVAGACLFVTLQQLRGFSADLTPFQINKYENHPSRSVLLHSGCCAS